MNLVAIHEMVGGLRKRERERECEGRKMKNNGSIFSVRSIESYNDTACNEDEAEKKH